MRAIAFRLLHHPFPASASTKRIARAGISRRMASAATHDRNKQPPWQQPRPTPVPGARETPPIKIFNSLTRSKTPFVPEDPAGRTVTWYACGPTVYDDAHLGHARNYVSTDIIRRIMRDFFRFNVKFVMNITDIDDKVGTRVAWRARSEGEIRGESEVESEGEVRSEGESKSESEMEGEGEVRSESESKSESEMESESESKSECEMESESKSKSKSESESESESEIEEQSEEHS